MQNEKLITDRLTIGYDSDLIDSISLEIRKGKIVTLIGPNGCGKSTLLRTLGGQLSARGGTVYLDGRNMQLLQGREIAKKMSMVMTTPVKTELMSCREVIEMGRYPYTGMLGILGEEDKKAVERAIAMTGTEAVADRPFDAVSDGQKQRVMLARAICQEPELLILDEPTSYLDIKYKLDILGRIRTLAKEQDIAIVMSLHELEIAMRLSDTVVAIGDGKIRRIGTREEVFEESFIRNLFGIEKADMELAGSLPWLPETESMEAHKEPHTKAGKPAVLMIQGTMSGAGKSILTAGLCRIFAQDGYRVAPFKSQNMALNSFITEEGLEMGRAQVVQAECCKIKPLSCMNPVLLKPNDDNGSQVIVNGVPIGNMRADAYFRYRKELIPKIKEAFDKLSEMADIIVVEGAGSPVELNLQKDDIVNMGLAKMLDASVLLVGDIDRGGVFAQLLGTLSLLSKEDKARVRGLIVNKFRGDRNLFQDGVSILEEKSGRKVLGVVPYLDVRLEEEDSMSERLSVKEVRQIDIAVIHLPHISNFTDLDVFAQIPEVSVRFIESSGETGCPDLLILPGTKNTIADLQWLKEQGFAEEIIKAAGAGTILIGICGGYQMLGRKVEDPEQAQCEQGLMLLPADTVIEREKVRSVYLGRIEEAEGNLQVLNGKPVKGYEIHMGKTTPYEDVHMFTSGKTGYCRGNIYGTYVHGLFDQKEIFVPLLSVIGEKKGVQIRPEETVSMDEYREQQYEKLAKGLRECLDMDEIYRILGGKR
ncbi:MAG: cobyric acid synthase [Lachnospiraceae bacterium]|nr:cobyric acid synthase [Lachnospiraceae bacterium]